MQEAPEAPAVGRRVLALPQQAALPALQRQLPTRLDQREQKALLLLLLAVVVHLPLVLPLFFRGVVLVREPDPPPRPVRPRGEVRAGVDALRGQGRAEEEPVRRLRGAAAAEDEGGRGEEQRRVLVQADPVQEEEKWSGRWRVDELEALLDAEGEGGRVIFSVHRSVHEALS